MTPRSNPLLAVEELHVAKQGSMTSQDFYSHVLQLVKRCQFPNQEAEERAVRDAIFIGMNSQQARDKAINLMNEEGKVVTVEFLMNHLAVEDGNSQHKFLSQLNSNSSVNMVAYDHRQNKGESNKGKQSSGRNTAQNKSRGQASSSTVQPSRKPPGMEGKCMRCGKPDHLQGQKCAAKNAKCKECHKIGHFYKVGFVERMVGVAKKLMDKAGSEGKPWISGLYEYRATPQSGSIASPLQLLTQRTPREKDLPQLPSTLGAHEMYDTRQEILRRQPDRPERSYIELTPGMAVWVQHKQNTSWEPAIIASQISPNSYWIMQENGDDQPKLYRRTRSMLKIRCTEVWKPSLEYSQSTEMHKAKFPPPYSLNEERNHVWHNSVNEISRDLVIQTKSNTASVSDSVFSEGKEENADIAEAPAEAPTPAPTLETVKERPHTPGSRKSTRKNFGRPASAYSDFYM